jgi:outer membrane protein assembly factor BamB
MRFWKIALLSGGLILTGWLGWRYAASQQIVTLIALNANTGQLEWMHPFSVSSDSFSKGPIAADGKILVGFHERSSDSKKRTKSYQLQALDAKSGKQLWVYRPAGKYDPLKIEIYPSVVFQNQQIYIQGGNELRSLDPATGQQIWAIQRPWFKPPDPDSISSLGLVALPKQVIVIGANKKERSLQWLDPKTGKLQRQISFSLDQLTTTRDLITADDRSVFLATKELIQTGPNSYDDSGRTAVIAYDLKTGQRRFRTEVTDSGGIEDLQARPDGLQIWSYGYYDSKQLKFRADGSYLAIQANTGSILWRRFTQELLCPITGYSWQVDSESVYLHCGRRQVADSEDSPKSSTIVALSTQTGQLKWKYLASPDNYSMFFPSALSPKQFLTFRKVEVGNDAQTQAIALDRQTGKLLWSFAPYTTPYMTTSPQRVATEGDRFFMLDLIPRWQVWLLQANPNWYLNHSSKLGQSK